MMKLLEIIRNLVPDFENLFGAISSTGFGPGWLFGALGAISVSLYGLSLGRTRAIMSLLSIYVAFTLEKAFPYLEKLQEISGDFLEPYWVEILIFLAVYVLAFSIFNFSLIKKRLSSTEFSLLGITIISLAQIGFLVSIILSFLPVSLGQGWTMNLYNLFGNSTAMFVWAVAPLPILLFLKKN